MARRRLSETHTGTNFGPIPVELRAGACMEVWGPDDAMAAWRRWRNARGDWLRARGVHPNWDRQRVPEPLKSASNTPWSFDFLKARDRDHLASKLISLGLSAEWTPVFVES